MIISIPKFLKKNKLLTNSRSKNDKMKNLYRYILSYRGEKPVTRFEYDENTLLNIKEIIDEIIKK